MFQEILIFLKKKTGVLMDLEINMAFFLCLLSNTIDDVTVSHRKITSR